MTTTDSGTETQFSDDSSSCEHVCSHSFCSGDDTEVPMNDSQSVNNRLAPPNIQPYSGVLEKGKVVIRPIAFKPTTITPSTRYGERYGSTPILTRPGSRLTLYGSSNDLHNHSQNIKNYSLDRKLRSSCPSASSSPPMTMNSLTSLPHKLSNYDSLESVRNVDYPQSNKQNYCHMSPSNNSSLTDLTPSPSDSGVSELEAALRDRDSELAYLRQTMEHNEQVIFRVYQEKEKVWERELKRLKTVQESRLRANAQKVLKLEQMLMMQTYQLQQDKKRLSADVQHSNLQCDRLKQEVAHLRSRLEETEWSLCQKTGEISLLKTQIKECQNNQNHKCQELLQLRNEHRETKELLSKKDNMLEQLTSANTSKDEEIEQLKQEIDKLNATLPQYSFLETADKNCEETERLKTEIKELREELSDMSMNDYSGITSGRMQRSKSDELQKLNQQGLYSPNEVDKLRNELECKIKQFENERRTWAQEKEKVLRYQRQLQMNYVHMFRRTRALEAEIESLTVELELDKTGLKSKLGLSQTIEL